MPDLGENDGPGSAPPDPTGSQLTVYGTGVVPDVTGLYVRDSVQDGVSSYTRQGTVNGEAYHLYRVTTSTWVAWFLTTSTSGYPSGSAPFFFRYQSNLGPLEGDDRHGRHARLFSDPTAAVNGYAHVAAVPSTTSFTLTTNRAARWTQAPDAWVHGYFAYPWADDHLPVASVDAATGAVTVTGAPLGGLNAFVQAGGPSPVYAYNLLEEITQPGEWYVDRAAGMLYLWPPADLARHTLVASVLSAPLVTVTGASHVTIQEVTLEATRSQLVVIQGDSSHVEVVGCTLRDAGEVAGEVVDGTQNVFDGDLVYAAGEDGVDLAGGDRVTLTPGKNAVENSAPPRLRAVGGVVHASAVRLGGDGNVVAHDVILSSPHAAVLFYESRQSVIAYNDIYGVLGFTSDAGAIYSYADWGSYGNLIEYNFIHDIASQLDGFRVACGPSIPRRGA